MSLPEKVPDRDDVVLEKYSDDHHGFMRIQVTPNKLIGEIMSLQIHMNRGMLVKAQLNSIHLKSNYKGKRIDGTSITEYNTHAL